MLRDLPSFEGEMSAESAMLLCRSPTALIKVLLLGSKMPKPWSDGNATLSPRNRVEMPW